MIFKVVLFCSFVYFGNAEIPSYIKVCKSSDPKLADCIINSVNSLRSHLIAGIPELNVPKLEPLLLDEVQLRNGPESAKIDANITNIMVWGPSEFQILELKPNLAKNKFVFKVLVPNIYFKGDYDIDMNILVLKYKGKGPIHGNFTNYSFDCLMKGKKIQKEGKDYLKFDNMQIQLKIGKSYLHLGKLFEQDPVLGRATNDVIADNSDLFVQEIKPALEKGLANKFTDIANKITTRFTYQELFPKD